MCTGVDDACDAQSLRGWIAAALRDGTASSDSGGFTSGELIATAEFEGVLPLLEWRLRKGRSWDGLPEIFRRALVEGAHAGALYGLARTYELKRIAALLAKAGIPTLLLKGPAFGRWLYPEPYLRVSSDIDLLFASRSEADRAARAFVSLGYELMFSPSRAVYEMTCRPTAGGVARSELDLHSRLVNTEAYAHCFTFGELLDASQEVHGLSPGLRALGNIHSLLHACLHRAHDAGLQRPDRLKWLYDIHLMLDRLDAVAWRDLITMAAAKGLCGICLRSVNDTIATFATLVPPEAMAELRAHAEAEPLDWRRLDDWRYMQWQNLKALPAMGTRVRWVWERIFPTLSHLRELHGEGNWLQLMARRLRNGWLRLRNRG